MSMADSFFMGGLSFFEIVIYIVAFAKLYKSHTVQIGLFDRGFGGPAVVFDTKERDDHAGAIGAAPAMDENGSVLLGFNNIEDAKHLLLAGASGAGHRYVEEFYAQALRSFSLGARLVALAAQIDDGFDAQFREL